MSSDPGTNRDSADGGAGPGANPPADTGPGGAGSPDAPAPGQGGPDAGAKKPETTKPPKPRTPVTQQIGRVVVLLLVVLFVVFAAVNSQHVDFAWIVGGSEVMYDAQGDRISGGVSLIVLMGASLVTGLLIGSLLAHQSGRSRRRKEAADKVSKNRRS